MSVFKCKMCGGTLEINNNETVAVCEYCGTKQTLPKSIDDIVTNLFNRANNLRLKCEFDKAIQIYEKIVEQDETEAEAYWGIVLCKYGIEYVEDSKSFQRIPTCHRTLYEAVSTDVDYLAAIEHADERQKTLYEEEAKVIDSIQKGILNIVKKEEPFDVFICYKETDADGKRTVDSVMANDIYHELIREGFKVFYSAITLEEKLGQEYEPYIFSALNSAKVMLVIGTRPEYFEAVWVKNEWGRFLKLMKEDRTKLLIPCYKDMDAYELPEEFAHFQAQDMGKIGFVNDVIRGIKKVLLDDELVSTTKENVVIRASGVNCNTLLERAFMFLEDGEWNNADEYCEKVLDAEPKNAMAYLGKLMAELQVRKREELAGYEKSFVDNSNYQKAMRFGDEKLKLALEGYIQTIDERNENALRDKIYNLALSFMESDHINGVIEAKRKFETIPDWKESREKILKCEEKIKFLKKEQEKKNKIERLKVEKIAKRNKKIGIVVVIVIAVCAISTVVMNKVIIPNTRYNQAIELKDSGQYDQAISILRTIENYKDSNQLIIKYMQECRKNLDTKISMGIRHTVGLKSDGTVVATGDNAKGQCAVSEWTDIVAISTGAYHTVGLKSSGEVVVVGDIDEEQSSILEWTDIVAISTETYHTVGLKSDGTVVATGSNVQGQCDVSEWADIVAVSTGWNYTVGLKSDGTVVATGDNAKGQCDVSEWTDIVAITAGQTHTVGLKSDGTIVAVGGNSHDNQDVLEWTNIVSVSAGNCYTVGLKSDGTVVAVGENRFNRCDASLWTDIMYISAGESHTVGLKTDGTLLAVGYNESGQCDVSDWKLFE